MICVSIGRGRHRHVIAEHKHLVEQGAQLVELRLDYINGPINLKRVLPDRPGPVIVTVRRQQDGGKYNGSEEARVMLLRTAIAEGVEYIDLEEDVAAKIPRYGRTKRIISLHDFRKTPSNLAELHKGLAALDPDVVKMATLANQPHDNLRMLRLVQESKVPTLGFCMGDIGTPSRLLTGRYGAPFSYATFHHERALAPGQLTYLQMREVYGYDEITPETAVYGVIGDPIAHSFSPLIHNAAFQHLKMNSVYIPFRIPRENLSTFLEDAREMGIRGLSVTIPHKEAVLKSLAKVDGAVRGVTAANTLVAEDGGWAGYNTDYRAAMDSLAVALEIPGEASSTRYLQGKTALVLGAGGAARAIAYGLDRRGAEVLIASRTSQRAEALARVLDCRAVDWGAPRDYSADILVNCTPLGMHPNVDETPYEKLHLKPSTLVFDTVYNPESTLLIKDARSRSCTVVTGVEMFIRQAALQFKLFTGQEAPVEVMREVLKRAIGPARLNAQSMNVVLIGYRGTGKSTVARLLALRLGWDWVDTDVEAELIAGRSITAIFAEQGEAMFRDLESAVLAEQLTRAGVVIAAGGGVVIRPENRQALAAASAVVWLTARVDTIAARLAADPATAARRPQLRSGGEAEIRELLAERDPLYRACATCEAVTDDRGPSDLVEEICTRLPPAICGKNGT